MKTYELTTRARELAGRMVYSETTWLLIEMACRLDRLSVTAVKRPDGLLLRDGLGRVRMATLGERFRYWAFGVLPREV